MMESMDLQSLTINQIEDAKARISRSIKKTPLLPLNIENSTRKIYLKLENLQPIGSFKLRGACNAINCLPKDALSDGVYTASAGNFAQGVAWNAKQLGIPCHVIMPDHAPDAKVQPTQSMGAGVTKVPFSDWWQVLKTRKFNDLKGTFIHPVADPAVIAGNGTIGLEILEDLPETDAIIVPYGGGGLSTGIALAVKHHKPNVKVFACEVETAAPLAVSLEAGEPKECVYTPSFVDGMGSSNLLDEMWPLVKKYLDDSLVVSLQQIADAIKLLVERNNVIAEGAGAAPVAAAMAGLAGDGNIVCVVSGGNIDVKKLITALSGKVP